MSCLTSMSTLTRSSQGIMPSSPTTEISKQSETSISVLTQEEVVQKLKRRFKSMENGQLCIQDTCVQSYLCTPTDGENLKTTKNIWLVNLEPTQISPTNTKSLTSTSHMTLCWTIQQPTA